MGLSGKPEGTTGAEVEKHYRGGHIREIAEYSESDVLNTYRVCEQLARKLGISFCLRVGRRSGTIVRPQS
jgi:hypothetical protein